MLKNEIYIRFMSDEAIEFIRKNITSVSNILKNKPVDRLWLSILMGTKYDQLYVEKKYLIPDFVLKVDSNNDYSVVELDNAITLFESLMTLPRYILSDERFWAWLNFDKCIDAALQAIPIGSTNSTINDHYLFGAGKRRGLFFGVLSRSYFRVDLAYDNAASDKYELARYVFEDQERIRNLTWRAYSSQKHLVQGILRAQKEVQESFGHPLPRAVYSDLAKYISSLGSVMFLDAMSKEDIREYAKLYILDYIKNEGNFTIENNT